MRSISTKITALTVAAILVSILAVGGMGIYSIRRQGDQSSEKEMNLICENIERSINQYLFSIEQSVDMIAGYASDELEIPPLMEGGVIGSDGTGNSIGRTSWDTPEQKELDQYLEEYCGRVENMFSSLANHTSGVISYYYRLNQELSNRVPSQGFLYSKAGNQFFVKVQVTDVSAFDPEDAEHVAWYYAPIRAGRPIWMNPYYNDNLGIEMLSYVIPIYKSNTFIGVIGMDISYEMLASQLENRQIFDTGFAFIVDSTGTVIYHPDIPTGCDLSFLGDELQSKALEMLQQNHSSELIHYSFHGERRVLSFTTLTNGLKLIVTAPAAELDARWHRLINGIVISSLVILVLFIAITVFIMRQITEPLKRLTAASQHISAGQYDIELDYTGDDEVGLLTEAFQQLVNHLQIYIADLNSKAYNDALTGVKNKGAYDIFVRKLNDQIRAAKEDQAPQFAIVMLDCNNLKGINDAYGHARGDIYLRTACTLICQVFKHSPVFRVGGDEFVAPLMRDDYEHRVALVDSFRQRSAEITAQQKEPWQQVSVAVGLAVYQPDIDQTVESVCKRADQQMYSNKKTQKRVL